MLERLDESGVANKTWGSKALQAEHVRLNPRSPGYIAQWLERLTADQQVPGSNPGVPSAASCSERPSLRRIGMCALIDASVVSPWATRPPGTLKKRPRMPSPSSARRRARPDPTRPLPPPPRRPSPPPESPLAHSRPYKTARTSASLREPARRAPQHCRCFREDSGLRLAWLGWHYRKRAVAARRG